MVQALALDTTGSTVIPVGEGLVPLGDYYLWCDHRAKEEAAWITEVAHEERLPAIDRCGGVYSSEWGFAKLLHWLRHNPGRRNDFVTALEKALGMRLIEGGRYNVNLRWNGTPS